MIAGLGGNLKGELYIDGKLVNDVEPKDRDINGIPELCTVSAYVHL